MHLRLIKLLATSFRRPPLGPFDESVLRMRVWPTDLDLNLHMNNGRYLSLMDLGRFDLVARLGIAREAWRRRWRPLVGAAAIRFRRSLSPFQAFELRSRLLGWSDKYFFIEQRFVHGGHDAAIGRVKGLFRAADGNVPTATVLDAAGKPGVASPPVPDEVKIALGE